MAFQPIRIVISGVDKLASTLASSQKKLQSWGKNVSSIGRSLTLGITLPLLAMGGAAIKTAAGFEQSMIRVGNLTGATGEEFDLMRKMAKDLGATTLHTASDAASGMGFLAMAGFETKQIMSAIPATLDLATAAQIDLGRSADITSNILTGYNKSADETNAIVDLMVDTMNSANTNMEQLAEAMKFVGPVASGMKIPIEDTATAIGLLSNAGIQAAMAGTNLRGMLAQLADPSNQARKALARLQIPKDKIVDAQGNVKDLGEVIRQFEIHGATTADFLQIFGTKIGPAVAALVGQGSAAFEKLNKDLSDSKGEARKSAEAFEKSFIGQLKAAQSALQDLAITLVEDSGLLGDLAGIVRKFTGFVRKIASINPQLLKMGAIFAGILAVLGPVLAIVGPIISGIGAISGAIASAGGVIALLSNPIGWIIAGVTALIGIISFMATHLQTKAGKVMIGMIPLGGVVAWIIARWSRLLPFFKLTFFGIAWILKRFVGIIKPILDPLIAMFEFFGGLLTKSLDFALSKLERLAQIALPEWLEKKIGLITGETASAGTGIGRAAQLTERAANVAYRNENETTIRIENRTDASVRTKTAKGSINTEIERGLLIQGAF